MALPGVPDECTGLDGLFFPTIPGRPDVFVVTDQFDGPNDVAPEDQTRGIIPYLVGADCSGVSLTDAQGVTRALYNTCTLPWEDEDAQGIHEYPEIGAWRSAVCEHPDLLMDLVPPRRHVHHPHGRLLLWVDRSVSKGRGGGVARRRGLRGGSVRGPLPRRGRCSSPLPLGAGDALGPGQPHVTIS